MANGKLRKKKDLVIEQNHKKISWDQPSTQENVLFILITYSQREDGGLSVERVKQKVARGVHVLRICDCSDCSVVFLVAASACQHPVHSDHPFPPHPILPKSTFSVPLLVTPVYCLAATDGRQCARSSLFERVRYRRWAPLSASRRSTDLNPLRNSDDSRTIVYVETVFNQSLLSSMLWL